MKFRSIYPVILVPLLSIVLVAGLLVMFLSPFTHASSAPRVALASNITALTSQSKVLSQPAGNTPISLAIGLNLRNPEGLATYLQEIASPQSTLYHHYLTPSTFATLYGPLPQSEVAVSSFLRSQGFKITATYPNHLLIDATGTVAQAESAFAVQINNYLSPDGRQFYANASDPSLPSDIAPLVASVTGLDNAVQYGRLPLTASPATPKLQASSTGQAPITCPQPGQPIVPTSYTPPQIATAYDFNKFYNAGMYGEGQTVGLLELDGFSPNDIALYTSCFGGNKTVIKTIPIDNYNQAAGVNASEVELDMEMVLGLAPHLATLKVYEASDTSLAAYNDAWAHIVSDVVPVVSTSWVFCEQGLSSAEIAQENIFFQVAAAQGQTILAASGDLGATACYNQKTDDTTPTVDDPASQPYVTGVGGTTLRVNFDNTYQSESVWNDRTLKNGASGGGISQVWHMPSWQQAPGVANAYSTGFREVPDVSVNADPQTGYDVYCSVGGCANKGWMIMGGTSAAAPVWAAGIALANEASLKANGFLLGFLNPSLYAIAHGTPGTSYASAFHDVVSVQGAANNNDYIGNTGAYPATSGYDMATGLGSFDAFNLAQNLITLGQSVVHSNVATNTTWYFAEGRAGGYFQEFLTLMNPDPIQTAQVQVQYLFEGSTGPKIVHNVPPQTRATINVNQELGYSWSGPGHSLSMIVTSLNGVGIVAERPMYFQWRGINSGTDALGSTQLSQDFYFADVESERNYTSFITILNPPGGQTANVTLTYVAHGAQVGTPLTLVVPAGQRGTTIPQTVGINAQVALHVHSDQPVVVERPMYFSTARANISGPVTGAATVVGTPATGTDWLFAEGYTGPNFHEYLVLANFDPSPATATVKLEYSNGAVNSSTVTVAPQSQTIFDVNAASAAFALSTPELSTEVTSDNPIVAERQEYFRFNQSYPGGTDVIGQPGPAKTSYSFAEGYTGPVFNEFLTLQNPNTTSETVAVTLYMANSITTQQIVTVGPQTRVTLNINSLVIPVAQANTEAGYEVSMSVQALSGTIVAERPMYFSYQNGLALGGTDVVGYTG